MIAETLISLTKFTRDKLQDVERELAVLWVAAQQVNARQKVEVSIRYCPSLPVFWNLRSLCTSAKVLRVPLFLSTCLNARFMSFMQSIGGILAKAAPLKARF